jgi:hypothetical protein
MGVPRLRRVISAAGGYCGVFRVQGLEPQSTACALAMAGGRAVAGSPRRHFAPIGGRVGLTL